MNKIKIEWADYTWSPITGCLHGCEYCYARGIARRFAGGGYGTQGGMFIAKYKEDAFQPPYDLLEPQLAKNKEGGYRNAPYPFGFEPTLHRYRLGEPAQLKKPQNIFVGSMTDMFGEWVPDEWIRMVFEACEAAPWHRYMFLTKNWLRACEHRYEKNWWVGRTITHDAQCGNNNKNLHLCYGIPKSTESVWQDHPNRFISIEPIHSAIPDLPYYAHEYGYKWVIVGAESGNRKSKVIPERKWVEKIIDDCALRKVPVFMKNSLVPIMGEENMIREFPDGLRK